MPDLFTMYDEKPYLYHFDLGPQGTERVVVIERVTQGNLVGEGGKKSKKPLLHLRDSKPLAICKTDGKTLAKLFGTREITDWPLPRAITIFVTTTKSLAGDTVECIRIRPQLPTAPQNQQRGPQQQPPQQQARGSNAGPRDERRPPPSSSPAPSSREAHPNAPPAMTPEEMAEAERLEREVNRG